MAKKPSELPVPSELPKKKLTADEVKSAADKLETLIDGWLSKPDPAAPPRKSPFVVPYRIEDPDVLAELVRRYQAADWLAAPSGLALTLALPKTS